MNPVTRFFGYILLVLLAANLYAQEPVYVQQYRHDTEPNDPIFQVYRQSLELIQRQSSARTEEDLLLRSVTWSWNEENKTWTLTNQITNTYNPALQLIADIGQEWIHDEWVDQYRTTYVYNAQGLIRLFQYESWNGTNWELYVRFIHTYNAENRLIDFTAQDWIDKKWVNRYKRCFAYHVYPTCTEEIRQYWNQDVWLNAYRYVDYYDHGGRIKSNIMHEWNGDQWKYAIRNMFDYACYTAPLTIMRQQYVTDHWEDVTSINLAYDDSGHLIQEMYHSINADTTVRDNGWTFEYDEQGNMTERAFWSEFDPHWLPQSRDVLDYNDEQRNSSILSQEFSDYWFNRNYAEYEYIRLTAINLPDISSSVYVYPNPASDNLHLLLPGTWKGDGHIQIFSATGENVWSAEKNGQQLFTIPISSLPPGNYWLSVKGTDAVAIKPFVKQ